MILFRGKRKDNGDWIEGFYIQIMSFGNEYHCIFEAPNIDSFNDLNDYKAIPETVGQFTGLLDKSGTKIFESDILSYNGSNYRVEFMNGSWVVVPNRKTKGIEFLYYCLQDLEIIGNIHDNPNLIPQPLN